MSCKYSVVIPLKNEEANIEPLIEELEPVMNSLNAPWELVAIDDGSTDTTPHILSKLQLSKPYLRVITFDKNYGQSSAFDAGFKAAKGDFIITLDGDRQNDPRDIPNLVEKADEFDLVCGWRVNRQDSFDKRISSKIANYIRSRVCNDNVQDTGCSLKVYRKSSLARIQLYTGMHRFLPALFSIEGFRVTQVPVNHRPRVAGKSNYFFFNRSIGPFMDMCAVWWMRQRKLRYRIKEHA